MKKKKKLEKEMAKKFTAKDFFFVSEGTGCKFFFILLESFDFHFSQI